MNEEKKIEVEDTIAFTQIDANEGVLVHFLMDAEGTLFLQYNPTEMLDAMEQDLYYLAHPNGKPDMVRAKLEEIVKRNNLQELFMSIKAPNAYVAADILAGKWLEEKGYSQNDITDQRAKIETKMRRWNDPYIIECLRKKYPGLVITVLTQASPEEYVKKSYEETLKNTGSGIIIAPVICGGQKFTKMDSGLYRIIKEHNPSNKTAFIDDDPKREKPAKDGGIDVVTIYKGVGSEDLRTASERTLNDAYDRI